MSKTSDFAVEATGVIVGAGVAYQSGDPSAGYAVSEFLSNGLRSLVSRFSGERQGKRIMQVTAFALNGIRSRLENGEKITRRWVL